MPKPEISLRRIGADQWGLWRELRLEALAEAPEAFGSKLAEWQGTGDTERRWRARLDSVPLNLIADLDGTPAGMVSGVGEGGEVELISMWVAPFARGAGVGDALIEAVIAWAASLQPTRIQLEVREDNEHAAALYRRHGFADAGRVEPAAPDEPPERRMVMRP
ncbi:MAG TPA: GNAT family N-acetyltransferase [Candidatus Dormibacteraeota bacterium]|jgi:ribosomal protein S18 acetylase RimI-like enzyme|nr:GNAT family N-acetyltransferase [Candidatus Dormibacteraeota bacterium]